jgi:predicted dinucleotide-binding enzyme
MSPEPRNPRAKAGRKVIIGSRSAQSAERAAAELGLGLTGLANADAAIAGEHPDVRVVSAFHNVAAHKLATDQDINCDVLVFGDDKSARAEVVALVAQTGLRGIHEGALANSAAAEAMTSVLIFINKTYQVDGAGVLITGQLAAPEG